MEEYTRQPLTMWPIYNGAVDAAPVDDGVVKDVAIIPVHNGAKWIILIGVALM